MNMRMHAHTWTHQCMHACMHAYNPTCIHTCTHTYIHNYVRTYVRMYVRVRTCMYVRTYVCTYVLRACVDACIDSSMQTHKAPGLEHHFVACGGSVEGALHARDEDGMLAVREPAAGLNDSGKLQEPDNKTQSNTHHRCQQLVNPATSTSTGSLLFWLRWPGVWKSSAAAP